MKVDISQSIEIRLNNLLENVGDVSLKRRARKLILGLNLNDGDKILDLGCGDGFYLYLLSNLSIRLKLTGLDYDEMVLRNAKKNLGTKKVKLVLRSATKTLFKDDLFDKAIMTEVLEHIEEDKEALREVYRIIRPGGLLVLTVPSYNFPFLWDPINWILQNLFGTHISGTGFFAGIWARHLRLYKRDDLEKIVKRIGFKIEEIDELTSRAIPFNHYLVNLVARFLYDFKTSSRVADSLSKFKNVDKPLLIKLAFHLVNSFDKLNDIFPGRNGLNIYIKARK